MEIPAELFAALAEGASFEQQAGDDRRQTPRVQITFNATMVRLNGSANVTPVSATVRDLSSRGVRIECGEEFHVADAFALRFIQRDGTAVWLQCEVTRWTPMSEKHFSIGAKFLKILTPGKSSEAVAV